MALANGQEVVFNGKTGVWNSLTGTFHVADEDGVTTQFIAADFGVEDAPAVVEQPVVE